MEHFDRTYVANTSPQPVDKPNDGTTVVGFKERLEAPWPPPRVEVVRHALEQSIERFLGFARSVQTQGHAYALVTMNGEIETMRATVFDEQQRSATTVVGRHSHCDSSANESALGLRHLLIVQARITRHQVLLFDLKSGVGTRSFSGELIKSAVTPLPLALVLGPYLLLAAETPCEPITPRAFIASATSAPVYESMRGESRERFEFVTTSPVPMPQAPDHHASEMTGLGRPLEMLKNPTSPPESYVQTFVPSTDELNAGILVGRYDRCAWPSRKMVAPPTLSRVHALLFSTRGETYIADLGSTFGLRHHRLGPLRYKHLEAGDEFSLGHDFKLGVRLADS